MECVFSNCTYNQFTLKSVGETGKESMNGRKHYVTAHVKGVISRLFCNHMNVFLSLCLCLGIVTPFVVSLVNLLQNSVLYRQVKVNKYGKKKEVFDLLLSASLRRNIPVHFLSWCKKKSKISNAFLL